MKAGIATEIAGTHGLRFCEFVHRPLGSKSELITRIAGAEVSSATKTGFVQRMERPVAGHRHKVLAPLAERLDDAVVVLREDASEEQQGGARRPLDRHGECTGWGSGREPR